MKLWILGIIALMAPMAGATAYVASQSGNWNTSATWGGSGVPGFGDTASIGHYTVTCPAGIACNIGTVHASFPYGTDDLSIEGDSTSSGQLVIAGTFTLRGQAALESANYYTCSQAAIVNVKTGGILNLDENGGSMPSRFYTANSPSVPCVEFFGGTVGDPYHSQSYCASNSCTIIKSLNNGTTNGILLDDSQGNGQSNNILQLYGTNIEQCGNPGGNCYTAEWYAAGSSVSIINSSIDSSGLISVNMNWGTPRGDVPTILRYDTFTNHISSGDLAINYGDDLPITATREISNCIMEAGVLLFSNSVAYFGFNMFDDVFYPYYVYPVGPTNAYDASGQFHDILTLNDINCSEDGPLAPGASAGIANANAASINNIYVACTSANGNPTFLNTQWVVADGPTLNISNLVFDPQLSFPYSHGLNWSGGSTVTNAFAINVSNVLLVHDSVIGTGNIGMSGWNSNSIVPPTGNISHITSEEVPDNEGIGGGILYFPESSGPMAGQLSQSLKNSISYSTWTIPGDTGMLAAVTDMAGQPPNVVDPRGVKNNNNWNMPTTTLYSVGYGTCTVSAPCTSNGTYYNYASTGVVPGSGDINGNPQITDRNKNILTWSVLQGQAPTMAGVFQVFLNNSGNIDLLLKNLFNYTRLGNVPMNPLLWGAGDDGADIGAVNISTNRHIPPPEQVQ